MNKARGQTVLKSPSAISHRLPKGQSVIEFLMTYGWAILILVIILAVLFYLGVLNPKSAYANTCLFPPGISCYTFKIGNGTGSLYLDLGQATGKSTLITGISCSKNESASSESLLNNVAIRSGEHRWLVAGDSGNFHRCKDEAGNNLSGSAAALGERYKGRICISYNELETTGAIGTARLACGDVTARIEPGQAVSGEGCSPGCTLGSGCSAGSQCSTQYCNTTSGLCSACTNNSQCATGYCLSGNCTQCTSNCPDGAACTDNSQCQSGYCISGTCQAAPVGWFYGTVNGSVIDGATVNASNATGSWTNTTNSSGQYVIYNLLQGQYNLNASKSGYSGNTTTASITAGSGTGVNFTLQAATNLSGCAWTINSPGYYVVNQSLGPYSGTCITIDSGGSGSTLECQGRTITGQGTGYGVYLSSASGVIVRNCVIINFSRGIYTLFGGSNFLLSNTLINNTQWGILLDRSDGNNLTGNTAGPGNNNDGIYLSYSNSSIVSGNTASNNPTSGISLYSSRNNNVSGNTANSNTYGFQILAYSSDNRLTGNTARNNSQHGIYMYDSGGGGIVRNNISNSDISRNTMAGIYMNSVNDNTLSGNTVMNNSQYGIHIRFCEYNNLTGNIASNNTGFGIYLYDSNRHLLTGNTVMNNTNYGIYIQASAGYVQYNNLTNNNASSNAQYGIYLAGARYSNFTGNRACNNPTDDIFCAPFSAPTNGGGNICGGTACEGVLACGPC